MKYGYIVQKMKVDEHEFWVAKSNDLKGCVGQGDTPEDAVFELSQNEEEWLITAQECNVNIPKCSIMREQEYSGKFTVRISKDLHRKLVQQSEANSISLNSYVEEAIAEKIGGVQNNQMNRCISILERVCKITSETVDIAKDIAVRSVNEFYRSTEDKWRKTDNEYFRSFNQKGVAIWKN